MNSLLLLVEGVLENYITCANLKEGLTQNNLAKAKLQILLAPYKNSLGHFKPNERYPEPPKEILEQYFDLHHSDFDTVRSFLQKLQP